ncbi:MAG: DUF4105 domain-containing protein [Caulobacterales bacterium]
MREFITKIMAGARMFASLAVFYLNSLWRWARRMPVRAIATLLAVLLVFQLGSCVTTAPRQDRNWYPYLSNTSRVDLGTFTVQPISDWRYDASGPISRNYEQRSYDFAALKNVWLLVEPQPGMSYAAHTLLLFEFEGDQIIGVTIEARREEDEDYSAFDGLWNRYEIAYLWARARDLLTRRAVMLGHEVFVYPLQITDDNKRELLTNILARTEALEHQPRFYNTLYSNCTNELAKATRLRWHYSFILTGYADEHLSKIGIIPGGSFAEAHERADITAFIRAHNTDESGDFDAQLLAELRRRETAAR